MRTTVTLDSDSQALLEREMARRGISFKEALNRAVRAAFGGEPGRADPVRTTTFSLGAPVVPIDVATHLGEELEDVERGRALQAGR